MSNLFFIYVQQIYFIFKQVCVPAIIIAIIIIAIDSIRLDPSKETHLKFLCRIWKIPFSIAKRNWEEFIRNYQNMIKYLGINPPVRVSCLLQNNSQNASATRDNTICFDPGYAKFILTGKHINGMKSITGHELAHIFNKDKPIRFLFCRKNLIKKTMMEVRADIDGRAIAGLTQKQAADAREELSRGKKSYNRAILGYPSGKNRVKYIRNFYSFDEAKKTVEADSKKEKYHLF